LFEQLKVSIEQEQSKSKEKNSDIEEYKKLAERQQLMLEEQKKLAEQKQKLLDEQAKNLAQEKLNAKSSTEAFAQIEKLLLQQTQQLEKTKAEQQQFQKLSEQQKRELEKTEQQKRELMAKSEQQKQDLMAKSEQQKKDLEAQYKKQQAQLSQNLTGDAERNKLQLEQQLLQEKLKAQEAQAKLMQELIKKENDQKALLAAMQQKDQQVALVQQEQKHLQEVLDLTRQQMANEQKVSTAVASIETRLVEQNSEVQQAFQKVNEGQKDLKADLLAIQKKSSHEIFKLASERCATFEIKTTRAGLFGTNESAKTFYALPVKLANGKSYYVFHYQQSPFAWSGCEGELLDLVPAIPSTLNTFSSDATEPQVLFSNELSPAVLAIDSHPEPQRSQNIVVVDLSKKAYATFPLRWQAQQTNRLSIEAPLANQVFGPLSLQPGQLIFGDDGRWIGFVMQGKEGFAVGELNPAQRLSYDHLDTWQKEKSSRDAWLKAVDPRRFLSKP
jgi:myosin heavy subunit